LCIKRTLSQRKRSNKAKRKAGRLSGDITTTEKEQTKQRKKKSRPVAHHHHPIHEDSKTNMSKKRERTKRKRGSVPPYQGKYRYIPTVTSIHRGKGAS